MLIRIAIGYNKKKWENSERRYYDNSKRAMVRYIYMSSRIYQCDKLKLKTK